MKKLFSKIAAAVIGLFTVCAPICAETGRIYIGNRKAFEFCGTFEKDGTNSRRCYAIKGEVNGRDVKYMFKIDSPDKKLWEQEILMFKSGAFSKVNKGSTEKFYNFLCGERSISSEFKHGKRNAAGKMEHIRTNIKPEAKFFDSGANGQNRIARKYNPITGKYSDFLFELQYYDQGSRGLLNDYETRSHTGAYIKRRDGSIAGKIEGRYLPPCVVLYLVLINAIEL